MQSGIKYITDNKNLYKEGFRNALIFYVVLLFTYSGFTKLLDSSLVPIFINEPLFFNNALAGVLAKIIPGIELLIAGLLTLPRTRILGLIGSTILLISFSLYVAWNLIHGYEMPCSCTGPISYLSWTQYLYFNIINLTLIFSGLYLLKRN
ncbi:MAG: MauE/DoxX family redox-associated membrane protein [Bacteroidota bacterium]